MHHDLRRRQHQRIRRVAHPLAAPVADRHAVVPFIGRLHVAQHQALVGLARQRHVLESPLISDGCNSFGARVKDRSLALLGQLGLRMGALRGRTGRRRQSQRIVRARGNSTVWPRPGDGPGNGSRWLPRWPPAQSSFRRPTVRSGSLLRCPSDPASATTSGPIIFIAALRRRRQCGRRRRRAGGLHGRRAGDVRILRAAHRVGRSHPIVIRHVGQQAAVHRRSRIHCRRQLRGKVDPIAGTFDQIAQLIARSRRPGQRDFVGPRPQGQQMLRRQRDRLGLGQRVMVAETPLVVRNASAGWSSRR